MKANFVRRGACALALAILSPLVLAAQQVTGTVTGRVTDAAIGRGLPDVQVTVSGTRIGAITGPNGEYTLTGVPVGPRTIAVRRIGYQATTQPVTVAAGTTATVDVALLVTAVNL
ncbi:MAG: carboxypeptidase-like regulatory domain-containing protein, partial [Gemmatimonadaceae bacterium]